VALRAADIYVSVTASITRFQKGMKAVVQLAEQTAKNVKKLSKDLGDFGKPLAAGVAAAVAAASQISRPMADSLERLKLVGLNVGAELGKAFEPAIKRSVEFAEKVLGWLQRLTPEQRKWIEVIGLTGVALVGFGFALKNLAIAFDVAAMAGKAFMAVGSLTSLPLAPALLVLVPVVAALALGFGALYEAADRSGKSLNQQFKETAGHLLEVARVLPVVGPALDGVLRTFEALRDLTRAIRDNIGTWIRTIQAVAKAAAPFAFLFPGGGLLGALANVDLSPIEKAAAAVKDAGKSLKESAAEGAGFLGDVVERSGRGLKKALEDAVSSLSSKLPSFGEPGKVTNTLAQQDAAAKAAARRAAELAKRADDLLKAPQFDAHVQAYQKFLEEERKRFERRQDAFYSSLDAQARAYEEERRALPSLLHSVEAFREGFIATFLEMDRRVRQTIAVAASKLEGRIGAVGELIHTAAQGMRAGGPEGAVVAVIADLLSRSRQFQRIVEMLDGVVQQLADAVGAVLTPVLTWVGGFLVGVGPLLEGLGSALAALTRPLSGLGASLALLSPIFAALAAAVGTVADVLGGLLGSVLEPAFRGLFEVLKFVGQVILGVLAGIEAVWNGITSAVASVVKAFEFLLGEDIVREVEKWAAPSTKFNDALTQLNNTTYESALAQANAAAAATQLADSMAEASGILNAPEGFKVNLLRYRSIDVGGGAPTQGGASAPPPVVNVAVTLDGNELASIVKERIDVRIRRDNLAAAGSGRTFGSRY
jgi:phage-related protein